MSTLRSMTFMSLCASLLVLSACASTRPSGTYQTATEREAVVTVTNIDVPNRLVTARDSSGDYLTVYVDRSHKAFPQASVGDQVRIRFVESMALKLADAASPDLKVKEVTERPAPGSPRARSETEVTATVRIEAVERDGAYVRFTGPRGLRAVQVNDPGMRDYVRKLKAGDHVEVTYKEALALSLEKV